MNKKIGGHSKIVNFDNHTVASKETSNKEWDVDSPKAVEAAIILDMLDFAKELTMSQLEEELIIINDKKMLHNIILEKWEKAGHYAMYSRGMATRIKELIRKISFSIIFKLIT